LRIEDLARKSRQSLGWDFLGTLVRQIFTLVVTIVLARLLQPEQFGLIGMAMVFVSLNNVFIDAGFTSGIIQQKNINNLQLSSIFYTSLLLGILFSFILYISATPIALFYNAEELVLIIKVLALIPFIASLSQVHGALLMKQMNFKSLAIRDILATLIGGLAGIIAAFKDFGAFALVIQQVSAVFVSSILLVITVKFLPEARFSFKSIKKTMQFSSYVFFDQFLRQLFLKVDSLFIGKFFSAASLGYYSRAESLNAQVSNYTSSSLRKVIFPVLSAVQDDQINFKNIYFKAYSVAGFVGVLSTGCLFFLSEKIIIGLLGPQWSNSILLFQILVFRLALAPFGPLLGKAMLAKGYSKQKFRISQVQRIIMLIPLPIGFYHGLEAFTYSLVIGNLLGFILNLTVLSKLLNYSISKQLINFGQSLFPLILLLIVFSFYGHYLDAFLWEVLFLATFIVSAYLVKNQGFLIIKKEIYVLYMKYLNK